MIRNEDQDDNDERPAVDEGMNADEKAEAESVATRRVRLGLLLTEIGRKNNIEVTEEDTRQAVFEEARRHPGQEQMVLEYFKRIPRQCSKYLARYLRTRLLILFLKWQGLPT